MSFTIEHSYHPQDTLVFHMEGEFKGVHLVDFELDMLTEIRANKAKYVTFDLSKVSYIDSAGIEFLFTAHKNCASLGQSMRLTGPIANIRKLFQILRLDKIIPID
jgi:anti-anti-sigma factor